MLAAGCDASADVAGAHDAVLAAQQNERRERRGEQGAELTHPPQDQEIVVAALRWLLSGAPPDGGAGDQPGPRNT
jgi:hypothetical protein